MASLPAVERRVPVTFLSYRRAVCAIALLAVFLGGRAGAAGGEIALIRDGAVYRVPVTLNGLLVRSFMVDTGAGEVQVSSDVLRSMFPRGSAPPVYILDGTYRLADGRQVRNRRFLIPTLRIGDHEFRQVVASIGGPDAPLLLGQNVLGGLGVWSIDNRRGVLMLGERPREPSRGACENWRTAQGDCEVAVVRDFLRDVRPPHDVTKLTLLRSDGERAHVLVDVVRAGPRKTARLCGPVDLRRAETGWRVVGASGLREVGPGAQCLP
jgi:gag-polyprotein putative aspartyl protease